MRCLWARSVSGERVAISGSRRLTSDELQADVERVCRGVVEGGGQIITGGALGVDFATTEVALEFGRGRHGLHVTIPCPIEIYAAHHRQRAREGVICPEQAKALAAQLAHVHDGDALTPLGGRQNQRV